MRAIKNGETLTLCLAGAVAANEGHWVASWINTSADVPDQSKGATSGVGDVTVISSPSSGVHMLRHLDFVNRDSAAMTVIVKVTGGTTRELMRKVVNAGESLDLCEGA